MKVYLQVAIIDHKYLEILEERSPSIVCSAGHEQTISYTMTQPPELYYRLYVSLTSPLIALREVNSNNKI